MSNTHNYILLRVGNSWRDNKRLYAQFVNKHNHQDEIITHFGYRHGITYIDYPDRSKLLEKSKDGYYIANNYRLKSLDDWDNMRENYIKRHATKETGLWHKDPFSPATLSRYVLWGEYTDIDRNINKYKQKFNL